MRRPLSALGLGLFCFSILSPGSNLFRAERSATAEPGPIRGAALSADRKTLYTWGAKLLAWSVPGLKPRSLADGYFAEGGCLMDVDEDGMEDLIVQEGEGLGRLVWRKAPQWEPVVIGTGIEMHDCIAATLFGRRGFLMIHRYMQVRFYEPAEAGKPWPYREIYSFYTPSQQAGLLLADVNEDGLTDIVTGNYWIRSPEKFNLPWRLFAINTYSEVALSAMSRLAFLERPGTLVVSQGEMENARLAVFERPQDPDQLWSEHRIEGGLRLRAPHGLAVVDLDGDGKNDIIVGEHNGDSSRLFVFWNRGEAHFEPQQVAKGRDVLSIWRTGASGLLTAGEKDVVLWRYGFRK